MFKKKGDVALAPRSLVSGADRKRLSRRAADAFSLDPEAAAELLPPKVQLALARFSPPSRAALYTLDGEPWLLDARCGRPDDLVPTVFALWRLPRLLPAVTVRHAAVSHFLINGADLMLPGVDPGALPQLPAGRIVSICVPGNPAPVAVGRTLLSTEQMRGGGKGRCVELLHAFGDMLWGLSPTKAAPNDGFSLDGVLPLAADGDDAADASSAEGAAAQDGGAAASGEQLEQLRLGPREGGSGAAPSDAGGNGSGSGVAGPPNARGDALPAVQGEQQEPPAPAVSPAEMDVLLQESLLQALHGLTDKQLPVPGGVLWNAHVLPARRAGLHLDLKASSHKKLSKLLQAHGQAGTKLLTLREDKASGEVVLTGLDRRHPMYRGHNRWAPEEAAGAAAPSTAGGDGELSIEEAFRPHPGLAPIFTAVGADPKGVYSAQRAGEVAVAYAQQARLEAGATASSHILLDATLCDALFKGVLKKGDTFPTVLPKSQLRGAFMQRMLPQLQISRGGLTAVRKGTLAPVQVTTEKRSGNKKVTRVVGVETFLLDAHELAADLQKRFAASATVTELPGDKNKNKNFEIVLQGEVVTKLAAHLESGHGIPKKYISVKAPAAKKGGKK